MKRLLQIVGPTAVGKSDAALELALMLSGEIISADSMQVYTGFDIGTAKPGPAIREKVRHHLVDIYPPERQFNGALFLKAAFQAAEEITGRGRLPIVCGGTALYLRLIDRGLFPEKKPRPLLRQQLQRKADSEGPEQMWRELHDLDPAYAAKIGPNDRLRIIRALEIAANTGLAPSKAFTLSRSPFHDYRIVRLGLHRERHELYSRIDKRVESMITAGLVEETRRLLERHSSSCPPFRALGYREMVMHLEQGLALKAAVALCQMNTRRYAKRQLTWLRKETMVAWFAADDRAAWSEFIRNSQWNEL